MDRHLVAVKVRIKGRTDQRMELDCLALHEDGIKCLDAKPVKCWGTVQKHRMFCDNLFQGVPHLRTFFFHQPFRSFKCSGKALFFESVKDKGFEEFQCHYFWKTALME